MGTCLLYKRGEEEGGGEELRGGERRRGGERGANERSEGVQQAKGAALDKI